MQVNMEKYRPNKRNYYPNELDYVLVFMPIDGIWREVGHDIVKYRDMLLSDYLLQVGLVLPDYCQFCRVVREEEQIEYRAYNSHRITISYCHKNAPITK